MKKLLFILVTVCVVATAAIYIFIPKTLVVEETLTLPCVPTAAFRILSDDQTWAKWWPGAAGKDISEGTPKAWPFGNYRYTVTQKAHNSFEILADDKKEVLRSEVNLLSIPGDSVLLRWHAAMPAGATPFSRITVYNHAVSVKKDMNSILSGLQTYLSDFKNVYGANFHEGSITDTFLVTTKFVSAQWPAVEDVYKRIASLTNYANLLGGKVAGTPMLNVRPLEPGGYQAMVGLPVNKVLPSKNSVEAIKMVPGRFIITEVTGGPATIAETHRQLLFYFQDYNRTAMAIPFDYLVTDRMKETDTSKWVTKIYCPVY